MSVQRYRKRPIEIEAIQWSGNNEVELREWCAQGAQYAPDGCYAFDWIGPWQSATLWVAANNTRLPVEFGEWILKDTKGFYPYKADVFAVTYEAVDDDDHPFAVHTRFLSADFHCALPGPKLTDGERDALTELIRQTESVGMRLFRHYDAAGYAEYCANTAKVTPLFRDVPLPDHPDDTLEQRMGRVIVLQREKNGLSRMQLSRIAGVSYPYLREIEGGHKYPVPDTLSKLAEVFEVSVDELVAATKPWEGI